MDWCGRGNEGLKFQLVDAESRLAELGSIVMLKFACL